MNHLKSWGEARNLSLKQLLMKTAFLLSLVCYKRPADLCNMQVQEGYWHLNMRVGPLSGGSTAKPSVPHGEAGEEAEQTEIWDSQAVLDLR